MNTTAMKPACLVVHGFGGTPFEVAPVAEALTASGYPVFMPTLPGHGTTVEDWSRTGWQDWLDSLSRDYLRLEAEHGRVFAMGLSMGGSLCLALAQRFKPVGVVTIAAPVYLYRFLPPEATDWRLPLTSLLHKVRPIWPTRPKTAESRRIAPWEGYEEHVALGPLGSFLAGLREVRRNMGKITAPLLGIHSPKDRHVPLANLWEITGKAASSERKAVVLAIRENVTKHHLLTTHEETRDRVAQLCVSFADRWG